MSQSSGVKWAIALGIGIVLILLVLAVAFGPGWLRAYQSDQAFKAAQQASAQGDSAQAQIHLEKALSHSPEDIAIQEALVTAYLDSGKLDEAIQLLEKFSDAIPRPAYVDRLRPRALLDQCQFLAFQSEPDRAATLERLAYCEEVVQDTPTLSDFDEKNFLGRCAMLRAWMHQKDAPAASNTAWQQSIALLEEAASTAEWATIADWEQAELHSILASAHRALGQIDEEEDALCAAVDANPNAIDNWAELMRFVLYHGRYEQVQALLDKHMKALQEQEQSDATLLARLYLIQANVSVNSGAPIEEVLHNYTAAAKTERNLPEIWMNLARLAETQQQPDLLGNLIDAVGEPVSGESILPQLALAWMARNGDADTLERSAIRLTDAIGKDKGLDTRQLRQQWGWVLKQFDMRYSDGDTADCAAWLYHGVALNLLLDYRVADHWFQKANACLKDDLRPAHAIQWSVALIHTRQQAKALNLLQGQLEFRPEHVELRLALARALTQTQRIADAKVEYERLLNLDGLQGPIRDQIQIEAIQLGI